MNPMEYGTKKVGIRQIAPYPMSRYIPFSYFKNAFLNLKLIDILRQFCVVRFLGRGKLLHPRESGNM